MTRRPTPDGYFAQLADFDFRLHDYQQQWVVSDEDRRLIEIADEYHTRCDAFDNLNLTAAWRVESMPATAKEMMATSRNAMKVRRELMERYGLPYSEFLRALKLRGGRR